MSIPLFLLIVLVFSCVVTLGLTPVVIRFASRMDAMDLPGQRKIHTHPLPRLGGIALYVGSAFSLLAVVATGQEVREAMWMDPHVWKMIAAALTMMLILGIWDDFYPLGPGFKFVVQVLLATIVYSANVRFAFLSNPFGPGQLDLGILAYPMTLLWIVGITNAVNLVDGLDGLASGVAAIAAITIGVIQALRSDFGTALLAMILAGSALGFLRYNFHPARIFLGDSGSLFLGFALAILSLLSSTKGSAAFALLIPVLALGLPIADTLLSMIRRFFRSFMSTNTEAESPWWMIKSMFLPDRDHIHHRLIAMGLSQRDAVLLLYVISSALGCSAFALTITKSFGALFVVLFVGTAAVIGLRQLRYGEVRILRNGILLSLYETSIFHKEWFHCLLDTMFVVMAYACAIVPLKGWDGLFGDWDGLLKRVAILAGVQLVIFWASGLYRPLTRRLTIHDSVRLFNAVAITVIAAGLLLVGARQISMNADMVFLLLYFLILLSYVLFTRFSLQNYGYSLQMRRSQKRSLIYGANVEGVACLQSILRSNGVGTIPVGFLDNNPELEGAFVYGFPVHGSPSQLPKIAQKIRVNEIIITGGGIDEKGLIELQQLASSNDITLRKV
jgi:UDP-GlcNAc:undecaprenyl-phosphate GlcNAc-1-phosphate transferase